MLGAGKGTVAGWEIGREPVIESMPAIMDFLGYDPYPMSDRLPDRLKAFRRRTGLAIANAAARAGVSRLTWASWEAGVTLPSKGRARQLTGLLLNPDKSEI